MELADMRDLGSRAARRKGSSPLFRIKKSALYRALFYWLFFRHWRNKILNGTSQLRVTDDEVDCWSLAFGYHHPLSFVNQDLQIAESMGGSLLE